MESNDIIQPMTGKKVCYNIGHDDLVDFANLIIKKTKEEDSRQRKEDAASEFFTRTEVKDLLHVCDSTLTKWAARKYLVPVRSVRSSTSDDLETVLMTRACEKKGEFF